MNKLMIVLLAATVLLQAVPALAQETRYELVCTGTKTAAKQMDNGEPVASGEPKSFQEAFSVDLDGGTITTQSVPIPVHLSNAVSQPPFLYVFQIQTYGSGNDDASIEFIEFQPDVLTIHWSSRAFGAKTWADENTWIVDAECKKQ